MTCIAGIYKNNLTAEIVLFDVKLVPGCEAQAVYLDLSDKQIKVEPLSEFNKKISCTGYMPGM